MKYFIIVAALLFSSCKKENAPKVEYVVNCSDCSVTYSDYQENTAQHSSVGNGWTYSWEGGEDGQFLYISAQNNNDQGSVSVSIKVGGKVRKSATSSGAYVIATASDGL